MDRRGFLGSLIAVTTAVASGVRLPSGREVAKAAPKAVAISDKLMEMLKECRVVSISSNMEMDRPLTYEVEYFHLPGTKKDDDTKMIDEYTKNMRPVSVSFREAAGELTKLNVVWM